MKRTGFTPKSTWKGLERSSMPVRETKLPERRNGPPRKRINPVSKRRQRVGRIYSDARRRYLEAANGCGAKLAGCSGAATDIHHILSRGRSGRDEDLVDESNFLAVCRSCHDWIETHRREAVDRGLLKHGYGKIGE